MKAEYRDYYFKNRPDGVALMSGVPLPKDADGIVRGKRFIECDFHPDCRAVLFENCTFEGCYGLD